MNLPDKRIKTFINKHHVLTLASSENNNSWCANCFYSYMENENYLIVTSDIETKHIQNIINNNIVSGSIVLETNIIGKIQGIQFVGKMYKPDEKLQKKVKTSYLKRFPIATLMNTTLWVIELNYIKMTDNSLGFGKKLIWDKDCFIEI